MKVCLRCAHVSRSHTLQSRMTTLLPFWKWERIILRRHENRRSVTGDYQDSWRRNAKRNRGGLRKHLYIWMLRPTPTRKSSNLVPECWQETSISQVISLGSPGMLLFYLFQDPIQNSSSILRGSSSVLTFMSPLRFLNHPLIIKADNRFPNVSESC
jgi:hypothetical protein